MLISRCSSRFPSPPDCDVFHQHFSRYLPNVSLFQPGQHSFSHHHNTGRRKTSAEKSRLPLTFSTCYTCVCACVRLFFRIFYCYHQSVTACRIPAFLAWCLACFFPCPIHALRASLSLGVGIGGGGFSVPHRVGTGFAAQFYPSWRTTARGKKGKDFTCAPVVNVVCPSKM